MRREGQRTKVIYWSAFQLTSDDWKRVQLCADVLEVRAVDVLVTVTDVHDITGYRPLPSNLLVDDFANYPSGNPQSREGLVTLGEEGCKSQVLALPRRTAGRVVKAQQVLQESRQL